MLPKISGVDVSRAAAALDRPHHHGHGQGSEIDTHVGLEVGADDYVTKPYRLRRAGGPHAGGAAPPAGRPVVAHRARARCSTWGMRLDPERHEVEIRGEQVKLPLKEFELLEILLTNAGRVLTRTRLSTASGAPTTWATPRRWT